MLTTWSALPALMTLLAALVGLPVAVLFVEICAALATRRPSASRGGNARAGRLAVLVPAHNEGRGLLPTIEDIKAQLQDGDRLLVVADNCSDDTYEVARAAGADVIARHDLTRIGKGYALDFGLRHLVADPPDVVIIVDADCRLGDGALHTLAATCQETQRPAQALYLMTAPPGSPINYQVAEFAWRVKNWARPLGLATLRLPCPLLGTGMAFPWDAIRSVELASGEIVEDVKLGLDLAIRGRPPLFCPSAVVTSLFPASAAGADTQRQRWEHGHIGLLVRMAPRLIWEALRRRDAALLALALDLAVPPLVLLALVVVATGGLAGIVLFAGIATAPAAISGATLTALMLAIVFAWLGFGRDVLPAKDFPALIRFMSRKLPLYGRMLTRGLVTEWVRTERKKSD